MTLVSTVSTVSRVCRESVEGVEPGLKAHFHGPKAPPSRRNRLLLVDYSDPNAGKQVCAFALGAQEPRCAGIDGMGKAMPGALLSGEDQDAVKMPLGKPLDIPTFRACLAPGGLFERTVGAPALRAAHVAAAARTAWALEEAFGRGDLWGTSLSANATRQ